MDVPSEISAPGRQQHRPLPLLRRAPVDAAAALETPDDDRMHARGLVIAVPLALGLWAVLALGVWWLFW
jgi:hypothetical protein